MSEVHEFVLSFKLPDDAELLSERAFVRYMKRKAAEAMEAALAERADALSLVALAALGPRGLGAAESGGPRLIAETALADLWRDGALSSRVLHVLDHKGVGTLGDLQQLRRCDLLGLKGFGEGSLAEVERLLHRAGLALGVDLPQEESSP